MVGTHCLDSDQTKYGVENHSPKKIILQKKSFEICIVFKVFIISSTFFTKFGFGQTVSIDLIYFFLYYSFLKIEALFYEKNSFFDSTPFTM